MRGVRKGETCDQVAVWQILVLFSAVEQSKLGVAAVQIHKEVPPGTFVSLDSDIRRNEVVLRTGGRQRAVRSVSPFLCHSL